LVEIAERWGKDVEEREMVFEKREEGEQVK
jgi:hypothetical protein